MNDSNVDERLNLDDNKNKAESLFSKKFREYLTTKKSSTTRSHQIRPFAKDYSESSSETASESSKKSGKKPKKKIKEKKSYWNIQYSLRNRLVQCSLLQSEQEVVPPDELKPLLMNITVLFQDFKQSTSDFENLYNLISKITLLVSQFVGRPLQKISEGSKGDHMKNAENSVQLMTTLIEDYKNEPNLDSDISMREYKRMEKEIAYKEQQITEMKKKISDKIGNNDIKVKDIEIRVKNSFLANENLKFDIKFNQNRLKKYKKALLEKEWTKHKLETEMNHLKKKGKGDLSDNESSEKHSGSPEPSQKSEIFSKIHSRHPHTKIKKGKKVIK